MQSLLFANLSTLELTETLDGGGVSLPSVVAGSDLTIKLRLAQKVNGTAVESTRVVDSLKASLGLADARPLSGTFKLHIGDSEPVPGENVTAALAYNATAEQVAEAINALTGIASLVPCLVTKADDTWTIRFEDDSAEVEIACHENALQPVSFVNAASYQTDDDTWRQTLRLTQTPVAQTATFGLIVPEPPSVIALQDGGEDGAITWNEIQKLKIPAEFRGAFQLQRGFRRTEPIGLPTSAEEITGRLAALADDDSEFSVTEQQDAVLIEFKGAMGATDQDLLEVVVLDPPAGDAMFTLRTGTAEVFALMDRLADKNGEAKVQLELTLQIADEQDEEVMRDYRFRAEVTMIEAVNTEARNVAASLNWNQPPSRRRYIPFSPDQIATGHRQYSASLGDGAAVEYVIDHNLDTDLLHVTVRENSAGGERLADDTYAVEFTDENSLKLTFSSAPASNALLVLITSAAQEANFQAHTHPIGEITGLDAMLTDLGSRMETLETAAGLAGSISSPESSAGIVAQWTLPTFVSLLSLRDPLPQDTGDAAASLSSIPAEVIARAKRSGLLPAVHDATAEALPDPLPTDAGDIAAMEGKVYQNQTGGEVVLPGGMGRRSVKLKDDEYAAVLSENGRVSWYRVAKVHPDSTEKSWYPTDYERELFFLAVNDAQLRTKKMLEVKFGVELGVFGTNTKCQWVVIIEHGTWSQETSPATTGVNLKAITWNATPILKQPLIITPVPHIAPLGCRIIRSASETFLAKKIAYGEVSAGGSAPTTANFLLRARLACFDTEDGEPDPRGFIGVAGCNATFGEEEDASLGKAVIKSA